jgi:hypothetical protein
MEYSFHCTCCDDWFRKELRDDAESVWEEMKIGLDGQYIIPDPEYGEVLEKRLVIEDWDGGLGISYRA